MNLKAGIYKGFRRGGSSSKRGYNYLYHTGQTTSYRTGDNAWLLNNFWANFTAQQLGGEINPIDPNDFTKVINKNAFGNFERYTTTSGVAATTSDTYIVCNHTGLMLYNTISATSNWNDAIDNALGTDYGGNNSNGGYKDWFLPDVSQVYIFMDLGQNGNHINTSPLSLGTSNIWTSTTRVADTTTAYYILSGDARMFTIAKTTTSLRHFSVRKHF